MSKRDRLERGVDTTVELIQMVSSELQRRPRHRHRYRRKRRGRSLFARLFRAWWQMSLATFAIITAMIAKGWFLGPLGSEGWIATPLILFATWAVIFYVNVLRKTPPPPPVSAQANVALLPAQTDDWLETQRSLLPALAQTKLDSIQDRLEVMAPQLQALDAQQPAAAEVRRLLGEELPELVRGYQRVPRALRTQPLNGGLTPEKQLLEGLSTIDEQLGRMHEQLAADDLHALATHQRYLELKYKRDNKLE